MKFYEKTLAYRIGVSVLCVACAVTAIDDIVRKVHPWAGIAFLVFVLAMLRSEWNKCWEITGEGVIRSKGNGFTSTYQPSDLLYAGSVREAPEAPIFRRKKHIELDFKGTRMKRYPRIAERSTFLECLQKHSPEATVVNF
jgi:hypothetical protein